jgi:CheY-like chemotaxis protein
MKKILIVEDMELNRDLLEQLLEDDYQVVTAIDGVDGIATAKREQPDLSLMDLSLPVLDGWDATRRIKADATLSRIPSIALTAHALRGDEVKALAAGCDAYRSQPIDEGRLFGLIGHDISAAAQDD